LLQLAHPGIAAGVEDHSHFMDDPFGRLFRTIRFLENISWSTASVQNRTAQWFLSIHKPVNGILKKEGGMGNDQIYNANDSFLGMWVWATLVWTSYRVNDSIGLYTTEWGKRRYYEFMKHWLGVVIPHATPPATLELFARYWESQLDRICPSSTSIHVCRRIMECPQLPSFVISCCYCAVSAILPQLIQNSYQLHTKWTGQTAGRCVAKIMTWVFFIWIACPLIPAKLKRGTILYPILRYFSRESDQDIPPFE